MTTTTQIKAFLKTLSPAEMVDLIGLALNQVKADDAVIHQVIADELTAEPVLMSGVLAVVGDIISSDDYMTDDTDENRVLRNAGKAIKTAANNLAAID